MENQEDGRYDDYSQNLLEVLGHMPLFAWVMILVFPILFINLRSIIMTEKDKIIIFDTTLRDGEQSPGFTMNIKEKIMLAEQLVKLGVDVIEAGFPVASDGDFEA